MVERDDKEEEGERQFRVKPRKRQAVLLTYAQCLPDGASDTEKMSGKERLQAFLERKGAVQWIVCVEPHSDGGWHYHALVRQRAGFDTRNKEYWDWEGKHPNIALSRGTEHVKTWVQYLTVAKKEGGEVDPSPLRNWSEYAPYIQLALDGKKQEALLSFLEEDPKRAMTSVAQIQTSIRILSSIHSAPTKRSTRGVASFRISCEHISRAWATAPGSIHSLEVDLESEFGTDPEESEAVLNKMLSIASGKPIVLMGPSGVGKTELAKMLATLQTGSYQMVSHTDDLKTVTKTSGTLICDDMSFGHAPKNASLHLLDIDEDRSLHARHRCAELWAGRHLIFTTNDIDDLFWSREGAGPSWDEPALKPKWMYTTEIARRVGLTIVFDPECGPLYCLEAN